jgi:thioredoxin reductase
MKENMKMQTFDLVVIGGGAAGLVSAIKANEEGIENILILERESTLGGALNEYIHNGFGLKYFQEELTGPEFAQRLVDRVHNLKIAYKLNTLVLDMSGEKTITYMNSSEGIVSIRAKAIILAMGCRERPRGAMSIPKSRCAGIFTAGSVQRFVNTEGYLPGREVVIMGSGDMGAIIARRLMLEGAKVKAVVEYMPYVSATEKNIAQCFDCFNIPLLLSHTVTEIKGEERLEGVIVAEVDEYKKPKSDTEKYISCDSLVLSIGLYPENDLISKAKIKLSSITRGPVINESMETSAEGIFACGCVLHIHNAVDEVAREAVLAAKSAVEYLNGRTCKNNSINIKASNGIKYNIPMKVNVDRLEEDLIISFKVDSIYEDKSISVYFDDVKVSTIKKEKYLVGDMESITLSRELLDKNRAIKDIVIKFEEE